MKSKRNRFGLRIPSKEEIAFFSGFYEGEGYCRLRERSDRNCTDFQVNITQKDAEILNRIQECYSGSLAVYYQQTGGYWRLSLDGEKAKVFIDDIFPYLSKWRQKQILLCYRPITV